MEPHDDGSMAESSNRGLRPAPLIALVIGCLLIVPAVVVGLSGAILAAGHQFGRDDAGLWSTTMD